MKLFPESFNPNKNLLPSDGEVYYHGCVFSPSESDYFFQKLLSEIVWKNDEALIFGKRLITKRKVAWYGETAFGYTYSNTTKYALPWTQNLLQIKEVVQQISGATFNACLLNLYHDGSEGMAWHSDAEKDLQKDGVIASVSFGAERKFGFKHKKTSEKVYCLLEHGSLLLMQGKTQTHWLHRLPTTTKVHRSRINLTFRTIVR